jgi:hypothetical protein
MNIMSAIFADDSPASGAILRRIKSLLHGFFTCTRSGRTEVGLSTLDLVNAEASSFRGFSSL